MMQQDATELNSNNKSEPLNSERAVSVEQSCEARSVRSDDVERRTLKSHGPPPKRDKPERFWALPKLPEISKKTKFLLSLMFTACLNMADFISDTLVVLRFGCVLESQLSTSCDPAVVSEACEAHPAWFGIGLSLLVMSNSLQSAIWVMVARDVLKDLHRLPKTCVGSYATYLSLFVLAFFQMHYVMDIALIFKLGAPDLSDRSSHQSVSVVATRELVTKACESAPQFYFQSYVLFAVGSHGDPAQLVSVCISVSALAHGIMKVAPGYMVSPEVAKRLQNPFYHVVTFLWLASDQVMRSAGVALVLSQGSRPYGLVFIALMSMAATCAFAASQIIEGPDYCRECCWGFFGAYMVPLLPWGELTDSHSEFVKSLSGLVLTIRWLETAGCALLAYLFTNCGYTPAPEVFGLICMLGFNLTCFNFLHLCFDKNTGEFVPFRHLLKQRFRRPSQQRFRRPSRHIIDGNSEEEGSAPSQAQSASDAEDSEGNLQASPHVEAWCAISPNRGFPTWVALRE